MSDSADALPTQFRSDEDRMAVNVHAFRLLAGMTQRSLAKAAGVSGRLIFDLEAGTANPKVSELASIAAALGTTMAGLVADPRVTCLSQRRDLDVLHSIILAIVPAWTRWLTVDANGGVTAWDVKPEFIAAEDTTQPTEGGAWFAPDETRHRRKVVAPARHEYGDWVMTDAKAASMCFMVNR